MIVKKFIFGGLAALAWPLAVWAGGVPTLAPVEVTASADDPVGTAGSASEGTVTAAQLANRPLLRPAEVLEVVPGLVISQHSGDGKANQYYLRGFNLDHGSDFSTSLLGMPLNMPTHGHGQGYTDLQFLIPELVDRMQYRKGPYAAEVGDFSAAGSASIDYLRRLDGTLAQATLGSYGYRRALLAGSPAAGEGRDLLYALEWTGNDGPWTQPERLGKLNGVLRLGEGSRDNGWSLAAMAYRAQWDATDQVPKRAVDGGFIGRYGSLDATDGGRTHRYSVSGEWSRRGGDQWSRANVYIVDSALDLWSNFSYCTLGCAPGDQFEQVERRRIVGGNAARTWYLDWGGRPLGLAAGAQGRYDDIGALGLYATTARNRWRSIREDRVKQGSLGFYGEAEVQWHEKFRSVAGLREDIYRFDVASDTPQNSGRTSAAIASPKLALIFGPWGRTEYYANIGYGFHSNDARGATARINPDFRDAGFGGAVAAASPLVRAKGAEIGLRSAPLAGWQTSLALWRLDLASELVFVGDAGTTEPSFPSRRHGIEWANYWTPLPGLTVDADLAVSRARYTAVDAGVAGNEIPGAVGKVAAVGISWDGGGRWSGGLRLRYFGPRPLNEDGSVRSPSSLLVNLRASYRATRSLQVSLDVLNLFDRRASDIDYYYPSQLVGEPAPIDDVHSHPAEPRMLRLSLRLAL